MNRRTPAHRARTVLALCVALQLVAETALTPYWPGLLRELFGTSEPAATGTYLTVCRMVGLAAIPLWGLAARRWPLPRLIVTGLLVAAVCDAAVALAPSLWSFTLASAGSVAAGCALVLAYPALVEVLEARIGPAGRDGRVRAVVVYTATFHTAAVLATLVGAGIVSLPHPRVGLLGFAVADLALALLVARHVPAGTRSPGRSDFPAAARRTSPRVALAAVCALAVLVDLGTGVARPFFLELTLAEGMSLATGAGLFLLPSLGALAALPAAAWFAHRRPGALLIGSATLAAAGLAVQAAGADAVPVLAAGRVLFGLGLGGLAVGVDLRVFAVVGTAGPGFAAVETARSAALLGAPALATLTVAGGLRAPLIAPAALFAAAALLSARPRSPGAEPTPPAGPASERRPEPMGSATTSV